MKKIIIIAILFFIPLFVNANEYYTNENNFTFTKEDYELIYEKYGEDGINAVTTENFENAKKFATDGIVESESYFATDYTIDSIGRITNVSTREVTEEEAKNSLIMPVAEVCDSLGSCIETTYKRLKYVVNASSRMITVTNTWLTMPKVRSYDIIAVRFLQRVNITQATGTQTWTNGSQGYATDGTNTKVTNYGAGLSMNLVDDTTITNLENKMIVRTDTAIPDWWNLRIYITYQHAQYTLTRAQSMSYQFTNTGSGIVLGNTILFEDMSIGSKYDDMTGLQYN